MTATKIEAGSDFPSITATGLDDGTADLGKPGDGADWRMLVVYRGQHCPLCTKFLNELEESVPRLKENGVDVVAVSGDSKAQLESHLERLNVSFPLYWGLTLEQMKELGLYISYPRSEKETDHLFPEPGLFVINDKGRVQVVDISNNPFVRPEIDALVGGLDWIRNPENKLPDPGDLQRVTRG